MGQVLLPLDVLKIKMQTNPDAVRGRGFFKLITEEGVASLYRGWGWTMARNAPGSFAVRPRAQGSIMTDNAALWWICHDQGVSVPPG